MALVIAAALLMALLYFVFKVFDRREVHLLPAIVINYAVAALCGAAFAIPWPDAFPTSLALPAVGLGALFIGLFYLTAISTQRAGVAATSVAGKMSLALTVLFTVVVLHERPSPLTWAGILIAFIAVPLASYAPGAPGARRVRVLPVLLFVGNASIDISLSVVQRNLLEPRTESLFTTLVFAIAALIGSTALFVSGQWRTLAQPKPLIGGGILGLLNYASLYLLVAALARSGFATSIVFPLLSICVILLSAAIAIALLRDRLHRMQWIGIALSVIALVLILLS